MNLYILFCPSQKVGADGSMLPIAQLALTLDDEAQYRCAGFVQAEIERYAEDIADGVVEDGSSESSSDDGRKNPSERMKNGKGKRAEKNGLAGKVSLIVSAVALLTSFGKSIRHRAPSSSKNMCSWRSSPLSCVPFALVLFTLHMVPCFSPTMVG
jgi:hypothetical protein